MADAEIDFDALLGYERTLYKVEERETDDGYGPTGHFVNVRVPTDEGDEAVLVGSPVIGSVGLHLPCLDIDYDAQLVESSTPGHFHLFLNKPVPWRKYKRLLRALAACDLIEPGYARASIARRATFLRRQKTKGEDVLDIGTSGDPTSWVV